METYTWLPTTTILHSMQQVRLNGPHPNTMPSKHQMNSLEPGWTGMATHPRTMASHYPQTNPRHWMHQQTATMDTPHTATRAATPVKPINQRTRHLQTLASPYLGSCPPCLGPVMWESYPRKKAHQWQNIYKMVPCDQWKTNLWLHHNNKNKMKQCIYKPYQTYLGPSPQEIPKHTRWLAWQTWGFSG